MEPLTIRVESEKAEKLRNEAEQRGISVSKIVREKLTEAATASDSNGSEYDTEKINIDQMMNEREEHLRRAERLAGKLESKQDLIDEKDERINELQTDKETLNARLSEAQKAQRHANKARERAELQPTKRTNGDSRGLLARLFSR